MKYLKQLLFNSFYEFKISKNMWTKEWPKKKGLYWFYGWLHNSKKCNRKPELSIITVFKDGAGKIVYVCESSFLARKDKKNIGKFLKIKIPLLPDLSEFYEL